MRYGFGHESSGLAVGGGRWQEDVVAPAVDQFSKATTAYISMAAGKIGAKNVSFAAPCSYSIKFYNTAGGAQIGVTKTGTYTGTPVTPTGVTCSDGVEVVAKYTCTTSEPGYKAVTAETVLWTATMLNGTPDQGPYTPAEPSA